MEVSHVLINGSLSPLSQYRKAAKNQKNSGQQDEGHHHQRQQDGGQGGQGEGPHCVSPPVRYTEEWIRVMKRTVGEEEWLVVLTVASIAVNYRCQQSCQQADAP